MQSANENFSQRLLNTLMTALKKYEDSQGIGADAYCEYPLYHAMADAKYLSTLSSLYLTNKISKTNFLKLSQQAMMRLEQSIQVGEENSGWGLGFSWRNVSANEPFLITTSLVVKSLLSVASISPEDAKNHQLLMQGLSCLQTWCNTTSATSSTNASLPIYSPNIPEPIYNAAAYALSTVVLSEAFLDINKSSQALSKLNFIHEQRINGIGWCYSATNNIIDLVHQCYILNSLIDVNGVEAYEINCLELLGHFILPDGMLDVVKSYESEIDFYQKDIKTIRKIGEQWIEILPKKARLWSLGELLVLVSRLCREGKHTDAWFKFGRKLSTWIIEIFDSNHPEASYFRHTMHAAHGMSEYLSALREKNKNNAK